MPGTEVIFRKALDHRNGEGVSSKLGFSGVNPILSSYLSTLNLSVPYPFYLYRRYLSII